MSQIPDSLKSRIDQYQKSKVRPKKSTSVDKWEEEILNLLDFEASTEQLDCIKSIRDYLFLKDEDHVYILKGTAGSGKTSLSIAALKIAENKGWKSHLCAPTGKAAKVLSKYSGMNASTIHRLIYTPKEKKNAKGKVSGFYFVKKKNTQKSKSLYIVDESSMISSGKKIKYSGQKSLFAENNLLKDLLDYAFEGNSKNKVIFIGDPFQLPPVGEQISKALEPSTFADHGFSTEIFELKGAKRQAAFSAILETAEELRATIKTAQWQNSFQPLWSDGELEWVKDKKTACHLFEELYLDEPEETIFLAYSNKSAADLNSRIRRLLWDGKTDKPESGDRIMVVKNHYYTSSEGFSLIANGESGYLENIDWHTEETIANMKFVKATFEFEDLDGDFFEYSQYLNLSLLKSGKAGLSSEEVSLLYSSSKFSKKAEWTFMQALDAKYGYAITGHKAQGGEWKNVFVLLDSPYQDSPMYSRWFYTAITRAKSRLFLVNPF